VTSREAKTVDRFIQFAIAAGAMAMDDAGLKKSRGPEAERVGCYVGAGLGGLQTIENTHGTLQEKGPRHGISPFFVPQLIINLAPGQLSIRYGAKGPNMSHVSACSSSAHAIGEAYRAIIHNDADAMIAGGSEATVTPLGVGGFNSMRALSTRNEDPQKASRPFDLDRDGFVIAEGAGILILEELEHAKKRGARIYAEVKGYAANADAHHITAPAPRRGRPAGAEAGAQGRRHAAVGHRLHQRPRHLDQDERRQRDAGDQEGLRRPRPQADGQLDQVDDRPHAGRSRRCRERHLRPGPGPRGDPPDHQLHHAGSECDLDYVPNTAREIRVRTAASTSFGFGGTNACLVLSRFA
jgi:3-oxoacyl-[acyl-carrier-protein] synthase II